jgi:deazaflavin-dependent oxidoreductase (nitroreductase family)
MADNREPAYLYLTTTGRRSGQPREIEIWFTRRNGFYYVIAEFTTSHWVQNLLATPRVEVRLGAQRFSAMARIISADTGAELSAAVQQLSREKYGWGEGLVVELRPETGSPASRG